MALTRTVDPLVELVDVYLSTDVSVPEQEEGKDDDEILLVGDVVDLDRKCVHVVRERLPTDLRENI